MPKSVNVTEEERIFLLKSIEENFGLKINSANDCELLSEIIFKETGILISYNTLRRFFKILPNSNFPSLYTVNVLSKLIGFKDFITLRDYRLNLIRDFIHENLHLINISQNINLNILNEIIPLLHEDHWENIYQTRSLIDLFIKKGEYELLSIFFNKEIDENNWEELYKYYVAFQPIHAAAKLNNLDLIDFIKKCIDKSKVVQQVLLQLYVEEDCLEGYYGDWINECSIFLTSDMQIFCTCIKIQYHFIKNDIDLIKTLLDKLNEQVKHYPTKIHPIILGRIAAWNFIIKNDSTYIEKCVLSNSDIHENISILTFFYRLVYLFGIENQFIKLNYITLIHSENLQYTNMPFNIKTELSMFYLILSRYYVETNEIILATKTFEKIDKRYQFSCSSDFFMKEYELLSNTIRYHV
jgi:hypothetical protein